MSQLSLDYDYPINEKKSVLNIEPDIFWYKKNRDSSSSLSSLNIYNSSTNSLNRNDKKFDSKNGYIFQKNIGMNIKNMKNNLLDSTVQLENKIYPSKGVYYDIPKNIPVNPRFVSEISLPFAIGSSLPSKDEKKSKPKIPQKSSLVMNKITSNYKNTNNNPHYQNLRSDQQINTIDLLNRENTSKSLPMLPNETIENKTKCLFSKFPLTTMTENKNAFLSNNVINRSNMSKYNLEEEEEEEEEECDYEYDYVCLESSKKLNDDDQKIKLLLSGESQFRYQNLIFSSIKHDYLLSTKTIKSSNPNQTIHQYYRSIIFEAEKNFKHWTQFTIEIIRLRYKPEIYFNLVKHILLSGQNLLTIFKLAHRNSSNDKEVKQFSEKFLDLLKQLVSKTKRVSTMYSPQSFESLIDCIRKIAQMAEKVKQFL